MSPIYWNRDTFNIDRYRCQEDALFETFFCEREFQYIRDRDLFYILRILVSEGHFVWKILWTGIEWLLSPAPLELDVKMAMKGLLNVTGAFSTNTTPVHAVSTTVWLLVGCEKKARKITQRHSHPEISPKQTTQHSRTRLGYWENNKLRDKKSEMEQKK